MAKKSGNRKRTTSRDRSKKVRDQRAHARRMRKERAGVARTRRSGRSRARFRDTIFWRVTRGTVVGTAKGVAKYTPMAVGAAKKKVDKVRADQKFEADYEPEEGEIPEKRFRMRTTYTCCNRRFKTPEALNAHHEREHSGENPERKPRARPKLVVSNTKRSAGKRTVRPVDPVGGRHRHKAGRTPAEVFLEMYAEKFKEIGVRAVTDDTATHMINKGFGELNSSPIKFSQMETTAAGLGQAFATGDDALRMYHRRLLNAGFKEEDVHHLLKMAELVEELSVQASAHIAHLKNELGPAIRAAKRRQAGQGISDEVLAN